MLKLVWVQLPSVHASSVVSSSFSPPVLNGRDGIYRPRKKGRDVSLV